MDLTTVKRAVARRRYGLRHRIGQRRMPTGPIPCPPLAALVAAYGPGGDAPEVLYLGGSESMEVSWSDWSQQPLTKMVAKRLSPLRVCAVVQTAYNSRVFLAILRALAAMPQRPKLVMLSQNVRQYGPAWTHNPNFAFAEEIAALEAYAEDPSVGVPLVPPFSRYSSFLTEAPDPVAWQRFLDTPVSLPGVPHRTIGELFAAFDRPAHTPEERAARSRLVLEFNYLFPRDESHPRLLAAAEIFPTAAAMDLPVVCWFHPLNDEVGHELLGERWDAGIDALADMVRRASGPQASFQEWLRLLPKRCFYDSVEHFSEEGRRIVADEMQRAVRAELAAPRRRSGTSAA